MMTSSKFDIDIDVQSDTDKCKLGIRASIYNEETQKFLPHPSGIYLDSVPVDPDTGRCSIPYDAAEDMGYEKVDILTNTSYDIFRSKEQLLECLGKEPDWKLLEDPEIVAKLPHIGSNWELVNRIKPKSVLELADTLALIRPGKVHLIEGYLDNPKYTRMNLYKRPKKGHYFKKAHAISYAMMIKAILNHPRIHKGIIWNS